MEGVLNSIPQLVAQTASSLGVDPSLAMAVASAESGFSQSAVSSAGAIGVMQLEPATAAALGVNPNDLAQNIEGGVRYLAQMLAKYGDPALALAAYNWGPGAVDRALATYGPDWLSHAPSETQAYVTRILGAVGDSSPAAAELDGGGSAIDAGAAFDLAVGGSSSIAPWLIAAAAGLYLVLDN